MVSLSEQAVIKIRSLQKEISGEDKLLRIFVESGGCSGLEYGMSFDLRKDEDELLESGGVSSDTVPLATITEFPSDLSIPYTDIASTLGITVDDISGGDFIRFLGESTGTDGTVTTVANYSATLTGQPEQLQAFNFIVLVKCSPVSGTTVPGTWVIEMQDLYGDGWDGAFVTFEIDGATTDYTFTAGDAATFNVNVPEGTSSLVISYTSGAFEEEHVYTIETPDGEVLGPFGPNPAPCIN